MQLSSQKQYKPYTLTLSYMQDPRIRHCLEDTVNATEGQGVQQFACNGTCEDDWPQVTGLHCQHCHLFA